MQPNCPLEKKPIKYEEMVRSHAASCQSQGVPCHFCGKFISNLIDAKNHIDQCENMLMECMCGEVFYRKNAKNHQCLYMMKKYLDTRKKDLKVMQQQGKMN